MTKRAAIYTRVSKEDQAEHGFSLRTQEEECRYYAEERGWTVLGVYREEGVSGATLDRPQLDALRDAIVAGQADVVLGYDQDRLSRKAGHYLILQEEFARRGVELHFVQTGHADSDEDRLMETIRAGIAEYERAKIAERSRRNIRGRVKVGSTIVHGLPPYGYRAEREDSGLFRLVVVEEEARIVRMIFDWYTQGNGESGPLSIRAIACRLSGMGVPTWTDVQAIPGRKARGRGQWGHSTVGDILSSETYIGAWYYGKHGQDAAGKWRINPQESWLAVQVPAIVDMAAWEEAQKRRQQNKQMARRNRKHPYLLAGRVTCGECAYRMRGCSASEPDGTYLYLYYRCPSEKGSHAERARPCRLPHFRAGQVDVAAWSWLKGLLTDPVNLERNLHCQQAEREKEAQPLRERLSIAEDLLADHQHQLERLLELYLEGTFDKSMLTERKVRLEETISRLESEQAGLQAHLAEQVLTDEQIQTIEGLAEGVREDLRITDADFDLKRQIVDLLDVQPRLVVEDGRKVAYVRCIIDRARLFIESVVPRLATGKNLLQVGVADPEDLLAGHRNLRNLFVVTTKTQSSKESGKRNCRRAGVPSGPRPSGQASCPSGSRGCF